MASLLQKLLTKQSATGIITTLNKQQTLNIAPPLLTSLHHQPQLTGTKPERPHSINPLPFLGPTEKEDSTLSHPLQFYPSFPFGFLLNPISSSGFVQSEAVDVVSGDSQTIWADSVRKKRKRKMNKHKYKKLRKSLRKHG